MRKAVLLLVTTLVLVLALGAVAWAASPKDIYDNYVGPGQGKQLTVYFSTADLKAYLGNAATVEYANPTKLADLNLLVQQILSQRSQGGHSTFPFTGGEPLVLVLGALGLICGGYVLRRATSRA